MLIKKNWKEKRKRDEKTYLQVEEKRRERKKEMDVGVFIKREERRRRRRGASVMKWEILVFLLGYFTDR